MANAAHRPDGFDGASIQVGLPPKLRSISHGPAQYAIAIASVAAAAALRHVLDPWLGADAPLSIFILPTVVSVALCGTGPALLAIGASTLLGTYLFIEPGGQLWPARGSDRLRLVLFLAENLAIITVILKLQQARVNAASATGQAAESSGLVASILDTTPHAIIASDLNGNVTAWNAAATRIFGWTASEVMGRPMPHVPEEARSEHFTMRARALKGEHPTNLAVMRRRKDGTLIPCHISLAALREDGRPIGVLATLVDMTEQMNLQEQLRQAQKMEAVGQLAAGVAHDFNNQLTAVIGFARLARETLPQDHLLREDLTEIERAADAAATLTRQLLAFSRRQILQMEPLNVDEAIAQSLKLLKRTVRENVVIRTRPAAEPAWILADKAQIEHVLVNLVVNARDAMPHGGVIQIETELVSLTEAFSDAHHDTHPGEYVLLSVTDTGEGMTREVQARIFEPFFTTKAIGQGTGLGLAMVYGTVRQMGGTVWVYSESGHGTTFKLYFPRVTPQGDTVPQVIAPRVMHGTETVLAVDDDAAVRKLLVRSLERAGYRVVDAAMPERAIELVEGGGATPQLLITDVIMPGMNGPTLAERLKQLGVSRVLYTSGYADQPLIADEITRGVPFLSKPFTPDELVTRVRAVLDEPGRV